MSITFKFRSSLNFDAVDLDGRPSISVGDLRLKIAGYKHLKICQDIDLVLSDAVSGQEYNDDNFLIPSGSSVIIKRVPAGSVPSSVPAKRAPDHSVEHIVKKDPNHVNPASHLPLIAEVDNFDDFGTELCPATWPSLSERGSGSDNKCIKWEKPNGADPRRRGEKVEASDPSESTPRGPSHSVMQIETPQIMVEPTGGKHTKVEKVVGASRPVSQDADLPPELKCSLCNVFFKEAVMIPCCHNSFCDRCIRAALTEKAKCPKCYSSKYEAKDLLPNLSLRHAIEGFLESQLLMNVPDDDLHQYAPDGESGIEAREFSCAVTTKKKRQDMPVCSSATEQGSNNIVAESVYNSRIRSMPSLVGSNAQPSKLGANKAMKSVHLSHKRVDYQTCVNELAPDFQGENQPHVDSTYNRDQGIHVGGGERNFMANGRPNKGNRTCYMCGSPDHFIRDCPAASNPHPMLQTGNMFPGGMPGYGSPYWNNAAFPAVRPFSNMYGNARMMPFNSAHGAASPFSVPPYMASMYGGFPVPSGLVRMGGFGPHVGTGSEHLLNCSGNMELQNDENRWKYSNEKLGRQCYDGEDDYRKRYISHIERERSASYSGDSFSRGSPRKPRPDKHLDRGKRAIDARHEKDFHLTSYERDRNDHRVSHRERTNAGEGDLPFRSDKYNEERHTRHKSLKRHDRKEQYGGDYSGSDQHMEKEKHVERKRVESDKRGSKRRYHSYSGSGLDPSSSVDQERKYNRKYPSHDSGDSQRRKKGANKDMCSDGWLMASGSDEDYREGQHYRKRKRTH